MPIISVFFGITGGTTITRCRYRQGMVFAASSGIAGQLGTWATLEPMECIPGADQDD